MELLVAILIIAVIAALAFAFMQRRRATAGVAGPGSTRRSPLGRRDRGTASRHPMAPAVHEHMQATDPHDIVVAEQRMQAKASQIAAGMQARAHEPAAAVNGYDREVGYADTTHGYSAAPPTSDLHLDDTLDPDTGQRTDGYGDPNNDPRLNDERYEGRIARDYDPNTENPEYR